MTEHNPDISPPTPPGAVRRSAAFATRRAVLMLLAAAGAGCVSGNGRYVLTPVPGRALTGSPRTISVRGVTLPQVLQRPDIANSMEPPASQPIWWAEPLDLMIGR